MTTDKSSLHDAISNMLIECDLFNTFTWPEVQSAARYFNISEIEEGGAIFQEGDMGSFMGIINDGSVKVIKSDLDESNIQLATLPKGRTFGEMAVLDGERRSATCIAASDCLLLTLSKESLDKMIEEMPAIAAKLIRVLAIALSRRLRMADGKLLDRRLDCAF
jgi:CRP/FNR family transcriptional regulator, cyclic AMP receptor protein